MVFLSLKLAKQLKESCVQTCGWVIMCCCAAFYATTTPAQIFSPIHIFSTASGLSPVTFGPDGTIYCASAGGGGSGHGSVFRIQPDGSGLGIIYSFTNGLDGGAPMGGLILSNNALYGTASTGGTGAHGTVFKINTDGSGFTVLHAFTAYTSNTNADGATPEGSLLLADGMLYGTASAGGKTSTGGTVFKLSTDGSNFTTLYKFSGVIVGSDGSQPVAGLVLSGNTLFGTTQSGGTNSNGTIFKVDTNGQNFASLHAFSATSSGTNADGTSPVTGLILANGVLYGTAMNGGHSLGTIFSMAANGTNFTTLYNFTNSVEGSHPVASLLLTNGVLYGTTKSGGTLGSGTIFRLNTDGTGFTNLLTFDSRGVGSPLNVLVPYSNTLIGTTGGKVYKLNFDGSGFTILNTGNEGSVPQCGLVASGNSLYGTASSGGNGNSGTIFRVNNDGAGFANLYNFSLLSNSNLDGSVPSGTLALSGDYLYGTTQNGGVYDYGVVYKVNTNGTGFTNLHNFAHTSSDGANPLAGVVLGGGYLYGTTRWNGTNTYGAVFRLDTNGFGFTNIYNFSAPVSGTNSDGYNPRGGLVLAGNTLYGVAQAGGYGGAGTVFKMTNNGTGFTVLHHFNDPSGQYTNLADGSGPIGLTLSGNTLYGVATSGGGPPPTKDGATYGTVFKVNTDGTGFVVLHKFNSFDGQNPMAAMAVLSNLLYGTTSAGGPGTGGTVFQIGIDGSAFAMLHTFAVTAGDPEGDLLASGGVVYGTSKAGGVGSGTVFSVTPTATPQVQFAATPTAGIPPTTVQFTCPATDDKGNTLSSWHWDFGDGATSAAQNPSHSYTNQGPFIPSLIATNINGATILGSGPSLDVMYPTNILNGGFETGTFTNWTFSGNAGTHLVTTTASYVHSGTYGAQLLTSGLLGFLSQTLTTTPGSLYTISCWLKCTGGSPNDFQILWNGAVLLNATNIPNVGWTNFQVSVTASTNISTLQFGYLNGAAYFGFDDASLTATGGPPPRPGITGIALSGNNLIFNNSNAVAGHTYYLLTGTNIAEPLSEWISVATNAPTNGTFTITATNAIDPGYPQKYFILQVQ